MSDNGGSLRPCVTLTEILVAVRAKRVDIAPALAGYFVLEIAAAASASGNPAWDAIYLLDDGTVSLSSHARAGAPTAAPLRRILADLIASTSVRSPSMDAIAERSSNDLFGLVDELAAALMPMNRAAGRRVLGRLVRRLKSGETTPIEVDIDMSELVALAPIDVECVLEPIAPAPPSKPRKRSAAAITIGRIVLVLTASVAVGAYLGMTWGGRQSGAALAPSPPSP